MKKTSITVAYGDGIGPEIMEAVLGMMKEAGAQLEIEVIRVGEKVYLEGNASGVSEDAWESLERTKVFLKAPITTPQGGGYRSLNVTTRKRFGLFANIRPCIAYHPFVGTKHPGMDVVIVRENEEDLYAGIEHRVSEDVYQSLKWITRPGSERIVRYAFEYARQNNRKKVTCFTKDNIMKITDGLFHRVFEEVGGEYPEIEKEHWIVDIGAAKLADAPEGFDVVVLPNLYGDILSDVAAEIAGSVGLAGSANIGKGCAMFEAIHGSAPRRAGQNMANPSGLLMGGVMMLQHIGQVEVAERLHNAWLRTLEEGVHTYDIYQEGVSRAKVGTKEFGKAVIERLGKRPEVLRGVSYNKDIKAIDLGKLDGKGHKEGKKELRGVDVFVSRGGGVEGLAEVLKVVKVGGMELKSIANRGLTVWPETPKNVSLVDLYRCRYMGEGEVTQEGMIKLLGEIHGKGVEIAKVENLYWFDGKVGFSG